MTSERRSAWLVFLCALLLFSTTATLFESRQTDISALRVLQGEVPYRDFWTMYAPGSFALLALVFSLTGPHVIVSNVLGIATSAAAVVAYHRLVQVTAGPRLAGWAAGLVALALFGTHYHDGFTSYPPALLLVMIAVGSIAPRVGASGASWAVAPGLLLGVAVVFKHDVAGYAIVAAAAGIVAARMPRGARAALWPAVALGLASAAVVLPAVGVLFALGAGPDMWFDLVRFPLTDFKWVRPQYFPVLPRFGGMNLATGRDLVLWVICNAPLAVTLWAASAVWPLRRQISTTSRFIATFSGAALVLHWSAAHVQLNTHAVSLAAWAALAGSTALSRRRWTSRRQAGLATVVLATWGLAFVAEPAARLTRRLGEPTEWIGLPRLAGLRASTDDAAWLRALSRAIADAAPADRPLLFLSHRNDVHIYAESVPFWLSPRRSATRYHELHPGITDTEPRQREMLAAIAAGPLPVVVREHRFAAETLDPVKAEFLQHVAVGSPLMDRWVAGHCNGGTTFGRFEVMDCQRSMASTNGRNVVLNTAAVASDAAPAAAATRHSATYAEDTATMPAPTMIVPQAAITSPRRIGAQPTGSRPANAGIGPQAPIGLARR